MALFSFSLIFIVAIIPCCSSANVLYNTKQENGDAMEEMVQRITRIEANQKSQEEELISQKRTIEDQAKEIADLKRLCKSQRTDEIDEHILTYINEQPEDESNISKNVGESRPRTSAIEVEAMDERQYRRQSTAGVSFSAYIDHDVDLGMFQILKYDKVLINEGGGYDTTTGTFTCPTAGVYMFSFFLGQKDQHQSSLRLFVNDVHISDAIVESFHPTQDAQGGNTVIKRLDQGDKVLLKLIVGSHLEGSRALYLTTFSGVMLYN